MANNEDLHLFTQVIVVFMSSDSELADTNSLGLMRHFTTFDLDKGTEVMKDKMPSEAVEQWMDDNVPNEIDGANHGGDDLVDNR
ncbi:hypothetical protein Tco_0390482 [Tanacetum coccineum]